MAGPTFSAWTTTWRGCKRVRRRLCCSVLRSDVALPAARGNAREALRRWPVWAASLLLLAFYLLLRYVLIGGLGEGEEGRG